MVHRVPRQAAARRLELLRVLPDIIREAAKPMEAIDSIKIVQVDGLTRGSTGEVAPAGGGNLAQDALSAALSYRAQAPIIDGLMKELGLSGASLEGLVAPTATAVTAQAPTPAAIEQPPEGAPDPAG